MNHIDAQSSAEDCIVGEDKISVGSGLIDPSEPNWRQSVQEELQNDDVKLMSASNELSTEDDDFDKDFEQPAIKSLTEATTLGKQSRHFAQSHGYQNLASSSGKSNDLMYTLKLRISQQQTSLQEFFLIMDA